MAKKIAKKTKTPFCKPDALTKNLDNVMGNFGIVFQKQSVMR